MAVNINVPPVPTFNPHTHDLSTKWQKWTRDFETFAVASGVKDDKQKRQLLLHCAGTEVHDIFETLEGTGENYKTAKDKLTAYFTPLKNIPYSRHLFRSEGQKDDESIIQYVTRLRQLAGPCEFGDSKDDFIRDQVIDKCSFCIIGEMADSVENPPVFKALFMGHSFVQQLAEKAYEIGQPGLKCEKEFTVLYHSIDDLTVKKTYDHLFLLEMIKPHVVILEIGTHDLAKEETDPVELVADIKTLAVHIMEKYKVLRIVISEMYYRKYSPSYPIRDDFIGRIFDFNGALRKMAAASENRNNLHTIITHKHRGMFANWDMYLMVYLILHI